MINELLSKYKDQKPKTFGENHMERCYPVSAVIAMLEEQSQQLRQPPVSGSLRFSEREVDFAYLCGVFNASGIDGLQNEIQRLKELGKEPHDIIEACRKQ
jgi:hypothetical protein